MRNGLKQMPRRFDYHAAFARNIGWVTVAEQAVLRAKRVAIAGLGGVGGSHLLTLARLGIGALNLSDFDHFELANFNRQAGATLSHLEQPKIEVLAGMAGDINPELDLRLFPEGVSRDNVDAFLDGVDLYLDGLDFFAVEARCCVFAACARLGIPAVTAAPLGMGVALLNFLPGAMSFEEYFRLDGETDNEQLLRFLLGLSPAMLQRGYLVEPGAVDFLRHRGPSTPMACELCAGVAATEVLKILLARGTVKSAPHGLQFDAYRARLVRTYRPGGNRNPLQRVGLAIARRQLARMTGQAIHESAGPATDPIERILDIARWTPSGDNAQPWRFEISDERSILVHGHDTRAHCVYDLQGHASQFALGMLLETLRIGASGEGWHVEIARLEGRDETRPTFAVNFVDQPHTDVDPLLPYVRARTVQRRAMHRRPLLAHEMRALEDCLAPGYRVVWFGTWRERLRVARLAVASAGLRLILPEAYPAHRDVIDWENPASPDRIPSAAVGLDPLTLRLTHWAMKRWERVAFLNRYLAGTLLPRLQLDLWPGISCAAHFALLAPAHPQNIDAYVAAGQVMQRFWLIATRLGLYLQPEMTPLIFHEYIRDKVRFSQHDAMFDHAADVSSKLTRLLGEQGVETAVFFGRIGAGPAPASRSMRLPLDELLLNHQTQKV